MHGFDTSGPGVYNIKVLEPFIHSIPTEEEQNHTMILLLNLLNLNQYTNNYGAAISLHSHAEGLRKPVLAVGPSDPAYNRNLHLLKLWDEMAGREAAMSVFHFGKALMAVSNLLKGAPTLMASADHQVLQHAAKQLNQDFPNYEIARHAAGHRAEAMATMKELKRHAQNDGHMRQFLFGSVGDSEYVATFQGQELRVVLTDGAHQKLSDIMALAYSAFPTLAGKLPPPIAASSIP